ncbi:isoleucine-tRNA ligase [Arachnomyces sp. PD_36]|nr:isoleucine-tRNA ligase [Arachnomyces sp. PD_36]
MTKLPQPPARSWASTLKLPKSSFPARVSLADQSKYLRQCTDTLYDWQRRHRPADNPFILHDGPPYANGELHVGHALNKILKDIICRVQVSFGKRVDYVPGWDCHGLPIEVKVLQQNKELKQLRSSGHAGAAPLRKAARQLAEDTVSAQMKEFRGWAIMADWGKAWKTMDKGFEMKQLGVFREMVDKGLIYRRFKPVYWSPSSGTALAEAELEYKDDHISTAALVKYPLETMPTQLRDNPLIDVTNLNAVIWTTTPWTLPANAAVAISDKLEYSVVSSEVHGQLLIAKSRLEYLRESLKEDLTVLVPSILGNELASETTYRPLFKGEDAKAQPFIVADFVTADSGSGLVHTAPGHGMDDYEVCQAHGIPAYAPVDNEGKFTESAMPSDPTLLAGKSVLGEGNTAVLEYIEKENRLLYKHRYQHKYPYDWRSKLPIIIRATEQWFADVKDIREDAVRALEDVQFIPSTGKSRLESFVKNRSEWCISRQRAWGVPIPALYHRGTGEAVLTKESTSHIMRVIEDRGIDAWWTDSEDHAAWIPPSLQPPSNYKRGTDTMDVWFDSGTSWTQIGSATGGARSPQADVYLEGTDQHRGWFQSGLLTHIAREVAAAEGDKPRAPFKNLITHGFTLDQKGRKMSKSIGNVVHPHQIMDGSLLPPLKQRKDKSKKTTPQAPVFDALGPDALRLWVASSDYTKDVAIGKQVLQSVNSSLHKYRVTLKLLLGALEDFNPQNKLGYEHMHSSDKIALLQLHALSSSCKTAFENYEFYKAVNALNKWANLEFSAFYIESIKDRLYAEPGSSLSRQAAQTTLYHIYCHLQSLLSPLTPLLVQEAWEHTPETIRSNDEHPMQRIMPTPSSQWLNVSIKDEIPHIMAANAAIKVAQEVARSQKLMGSSLQSFAHLSVPSPSGSIFERHIKELPDLFVVSSLSVSSSQEGEVPTEVSNAEWTISEQFELPDGQKGTAYVYAPQDSKCARCWRYVVPEDSKSEDMLCQRCEGAVQELGDGPASS